MSLLSTISLERILSGRPIKVAPNLDFYQPSMYDIVEMTEDKYWFLIRLWTLKREELEGADTRELSDYDLWRAHVFHIPELKEGLEDSCLIFFRKKVEFMPANYTIFIGDIESGLYLEEESFKFIRNIFNSLVEFSNTSKKEEPQYNEEAAMDARQKEIIAKMKKAEQRLGSMKKSDYSLGKRIVGLVAIGNYTFDEVYDMTMVQFIHLLSKYTDIERYSLYTLISPYISSDNEQENTHWLNT